jgi:hypothetical protein
MTADLSGEALIESLLERIRAFCRANADEKIVVKYAKYFKEGYDAYGVDGKASTEEAKRIYMEYRDTLGFEGFLDLCDLLMESGKYVPPALAQVLRGAKTGCGQALPGTWQKPSAQHPSPGLPQQSDVQAMA